MGDVDRLAEDLAAMAARFRETAGGKLTRELSRRIGKAVEALQPAVEARLIPDFPDRYAQTLGRSLKFRRYTTTTGDGMEVTVNMTAPTAGNRSRGRRIQRLEQGILWHPLYGRFPRGDPRNRWYSQEVTPGFFTGPAGRVRDEVRGQIREALRDVTRKAVSG